MNVAVVVMIVLRKRSGAAHHDGFVPLKVFLVPLLIRSHGVVAELGVVRRGLRCRRVGMYGLPWSIRQSILPRS